MSNISAHPPGPQPMPKDEQSGTGRVSQGIEYICRAARNRHLIHLVENPVNRREAKTQRQRMPPEERGRILIEQRPIPQQAKNKIDSHMPEFVRADRKLEHRDRGDG